MIGFIIVLVMVTVTLTAMVIDLTNLHSQVKEQTRQYNELKRRL